MSSAAVPQPGVNRNDRRLHDGCQCASERDGVILFAAALTGSARDTPVGAKSEFSGVLDIATQTEAPHTVKLTDIEPPSTEACQ